MQILLYDSCFNLTNIKNKYICFFINHVTEDGNQKFKPSVHICIAVIDTV